MSDQNRFKFLNKRISTPTGIFIIALVILIAGGGIMAWQYKYSVKEKVETPTVETSEEKIIEEEFIPLKSSPSPLFIESLNNAKDVKIDFRYEGDYPGVVEWPKSEFYTPKGSNEKFLSLSKTKREIGRYVYGPDYYDIFNLEGSHWYGGTPIYLLNPKSKYSVSYVGFQINNRDLISELKIEFGIDYYGAVSKFESSIFASIFGIESIYACGPGKYVRSVGSSNLTFAEESNGIAWYRLEKPIALYDLRLSYCDQDCSSMPDHCHYWAEVPPECEGYFCCHLNTSISSLENGNLRMHIMYKPNDKEGFLKLRMVNLILSDSAGKYYQPTMGENFDHYYRAYFH